METQTNPREQAIPRSSILWLALTILLLLTIYGLGAVVSAGKDPGPRNQEAHIAAAPQTGGALIDNGTILLGVHREGHLNVPGGPPSPETGTTTVGLRYLPTGSEATASGFLSEGWGAADGLTGVSGWANEDYGGSLNITPISFFTTTTTAVSTVQIGGVLSVTHDYHPSPLTPYLYQVKVTIENISTEMIIPLYRRVIDWDIEPTAFSEFVTIQNGTASSVTFTSDDGFASPDPLGPQTSIYFAGEAIDDGPEDHGALFDLEFHDLLPGQSLTFYTFLGAAGSETAAIGALADAEAEAYSFGQPSDPYDPTVGEPNTFILAFKDVGGLPIFPTLPILPSIVLTKTVGTDPSLCAATDTIEVDEGDKVFYCYKVENTGGITLTLHSLADSKLGTILDGFATTLEPTVSAWLTESATILTDTVNGATWTAYNAGPTDMVASTDVATVTIRGDPTLPSIVLTKTVGSDPRYCAPSDTLEVDEGDKVAYCFKVRNTGGVPLTLHSLVDNELGIIFVDDPFTLEPDVAAWITKSATILTDTVNTATWTAYNAGPTDVVTSTDVATVTIRGDPTLPSIVLTKTVGMDPNFCGATDAIEVDEGDEVTYCYKVRNTGGVSLTLHSLVDNELGTILDGFVFTLEPTVSAWLTRSATIRTDTVNTATWTAYNAGPTDVVTSTDVATVTIRPFFVYLPYVERNK